MSDLLELLKAQKRAPTAAQVRKSPANQTKKLPDPKPAHITEKIIEQESMDLISCVSKIWEGQIVTESFFHKGEGENGTYVYRLRNAKFDIIEEKEFDDWDKAKIYGAHSQESIDESEGLVSIITDVLTKIEMLSSEQAYLFKLLTDPTEREPFELISTNNIVSRVEESVDELLETGKSTDPSTYLQFKAKEIIKKIRNTNVR